MKLKAIASKIIIPLMLVSSGFAEAKQKSYIVWVDCIEHHVNLNGKSQKEWINENKFSNIVNASFYYVAKRKSIPLSPYASYEGLVGVKRQRQWWTVGVSDSGYLQLKPPGNYLNYQSGFLLSICPPLVYDGIDIPSSKLYKCGSKPFIMRNCPRTLIGRTKAGETFICVTYGSIQKVRKFIRTNIKDVDWLANLDGGTSTFMTIDKKHLIKTKRAVPSIINFTFYKIDIL
jgi:hypothetical protein